MSAFHDHKCSNENKKFYWNLQNDDRMLKRTIKQGQHACHKSLALLFRIAYFIKKQSLSYAEFLSLYLLFVNVKTLIIEFMYHDDKSCVDLIACLFYVIKNNYQ